MKNPLFRKVLRILIFGILLVSVLPNLFSSSWLLDNFAHFKVQYLILSIILLILAGLLLKKKILAFILLGLSILWNGYFIVPYYFESTDVASNIQKSFKITGINLLSSNFEIDLVKSYISQEDPDVLILLEFTPRWEEDLAPIIRHYPYRQLVSRTDNFGIALLSKFEMNSTVDYFDLNNKPSIIGELNLQGRAFSIVATHPVPPVNQSTFEHRNKQLMNIAGRIPVLPENLIIAGDFNTSSFSNHFNTLLGEKMKDSRIGFGLLPTWPAGFRIFQTTLDHFLVSKNLTVLERSTGPNIGSDHLPVNIIVGIN